MTTYRLPDALGGGEYEEYRHVDGSTEAPAGAVAFLEAGAIFTVARGLLTEVKPPLPSEPPEGAYAIGGYLAVRIAGHLAPRRGCTWFSTGGGDDRPYRWSSWDELWRRIGGDDVEVCRLVPDPFAGPVELPWESNPPAAPEDRIMRTSVRVLSEAVEDCNDAGCHGIAVHLDPAGARAKARALWAAADAVEARAGAR